MRRLLCAIVLIAGCGLAGCGGKASEHERDPDGAGAPGGGASGSPAVGGGSNAAPASSVAVSGDPSDIDPDAKPECSPGFQGFSAKVGGLTIDFKAFVFEPGDYQGDSVRILWLDALRANGEHYRAAAGTTESSGAISLHVQQVKPRFIGHLEAIVPAEDDSTAKPLMLQLTFDIAVREGCA